jgi:hypothetical protein
MICLDFRRGVLANPRQIAPEARSHADACAACREFLERQRELDATLYEALRVTPPDGLADRILVARGIRQGRRQWLWAIAASVMVVAGVAMLAPRESGDALGREAIVHVASEPQSFARGSPMPPAFLDSALAYQGMRLAAAVGEVTYAQLCPMAGSIARHLVVETAGGPVTIFLAPDATAPGERSVTEKDGMAAITLPAAKGVITIVASRLDRAVAVERALAAT